ncbi:AMP-binding protein [Nocardiopsis sp. CNR-923]|uniref:AMP-binding protein n=1 Tax=Nocardiopsis sp. CNR-923 TaxID=1904965 RepID=UPI0021CC750D|nr:AMP-binding protein [Nocardiopsis sp. CNR-923]
MRVLHLSGEPLRARLAQDLATRLPHLRVRNIYGATEVCADATAHQVTGRETGNVPIGTPLPGVTARVLHEDGGSVPDGTTGELVIGGAGLALGYVGDPARTAARFVPAADGVGRREYRTGDLAVRRTDGALEVLGRADRQIKVRGVRVEPAEVETALVDHAAIAEALVVQRDRAGHAPSWSPTSIRRLRNRARPSYGASCANGSSPPRSPTRGGRRGLASPGVRQDRRRQPARTRP